MQQVLELGQDISEMFKANHFAIFYNQSMYVT